MDRRKVSLAVMGAAVLALIVLAPDVLLVVFAGLLFGVFFHGGGSFVARRTGMPHGAGIAVFALGAVLLLAAAFLAFAPSMAEQFETLTEELPAALDDLRERVESYSWGEWLIERASPEGLLSREGGSAAASAVSSTFGALGNFVIIVFIGLYSAIAPDTYRAGLLALVAPSLRPRMRVVLEKIAQALRNWLGAQLLAMTVVGVLTGLGLWILGIPLAFLLGLIAALLAFIPNIGPVLAALPGILLAMPEGMSTMLLVAGVYIAVQALESYVITPVIQQERASLPPALVISMQLLMGVSFGILGLALAMPLTAAAMTLIRETYVHTYLEHEPDGAD